MNGYAHLHVGLEILSDVQESGVQFSGGDEYVEFDCLGSIQ